MPETGNSLSFDTAKTVLVPVELYERGTEEEYLRFNGMALSAGEKAVASEPRRGIVAIMGIRAEEWENYERKYERGEVTVTSPLIFVATGAAGCDEKRRKREVNIFLTDENAYLAVWEKGRGDEGGLRMAEVLPDTSTDSLLYYMQVVGRSFNLRRFDINIGGQCAGMVAETLRHYFKNVKTVSFGL